ncbi:MAG: hypothetical protein IJC99_00550 [Clostridia bacterium]|nr:hypothetical protein [Clostridia bacterium]
MEKEQTFFCMVRARLSSAANRVYLLCTLRYLYPLFWAVTLTLIGIPYNIRAGRLGKLSLWRLLFNTFKQGRRALLAGGLSPEGRSYYTLLLIGVGVALLALFAALAFIGISLYTYFVATGKQQDPARRRAVKIFHRAIFPNRIWLYLANLLLIVPALFPLYFSIVHNRHPGGGFIEIGFDPVLILSLVFALLLAVLCLFLRKREKHTALDIFYVEPEESLATAVADGDGEDDAAEDEETEV